MTASTEDPGDPSAGAFEPIAPLAAADVDDALALSATAHWNQTADDWRTMLALGQGWGLRARAPDGSRPLVASTVVLPYDGGFAWISMVLVQPAWRGQGLATRLLRHAMVHLAARGLTPILDATPAGHAVYARQGFGDTWGFARWRREAAVIGAAAGPAPRTMTTRALCDSDWPAVAALDRPAFGADRLPLLLALARRLPAVARVAVDAEGRVCGYVLGRDGRDASQVGPLLAPDAGVAQALLGDALAVLAGPVYVDLCDHQRPLLPWLQARGFAFQRPFTRMVFDPTRALPVAPGRPDTIVLVAGPELG